MKHSKTIVITGLVLVMLLLAPATQAYVLLGVNWLYLGGNPVTVNIYVNPNCADPNAPNELATLQSAMNSWTNCGARFAFNYAGPTSVTGQYPYNGQNDVCWNPGSSGGALATTYIWGGAPNMTQADMVFWDVWNWSTGTPSYAEFDVESVALHEFGHIVGLDHSQYNWAVMWYAIANGEVQRVLTSDDIDGAIAIYGASGGYSLSVTNVPTGSVNIPTAGGSIPYNITVHNVSTSTVIFDGWTEYEDSGGTPQGLIIFRNNVSLGAGLTIARSLVLTIAGSVPNGTYTYYLRVASNYPGPIIDEEGWQFFKYGGDGMEPWISETASSGWDDPGIAVKAVVPEKFEVSGGYPNPFNPETAIQFDLPQAAHVNLVIYDLQGRAVANLLDGSFDAGRYTARWNAANYPSGTYIYRLSSDLGQASGQLALVK